ncbi:MAG: ATP-binding cassette domain-containing protein, partial [Candidatus Limnocylindrales bacterium]
MIEGRGLIQLYGRQAGATASLRGLDLDVAHGEIVAIIGPSGSGKSTLLRLLAAAERPSSGTLHVMGLPLERASEMDLRRYRQ